MTDTLQQSLIEKALRAAFETLEMARLWPIRFPMAESSGMIMRIDECRVLLIDALATEALKSSEIPVNKLDAFALEEARQVAHERQYVDDLPIVIRKAIVAYLDALIRTR